MSHWDPAKQSKPGSLVKETSHYRRKLPTRGNRRCDAVLPIIRDSSLHFQGSSVDLGSVCGKPFTVAAMVVTDPGDST